MSKTTTDWIDIDLNGTIDAALKKLTKLKAEYPKGRIEVGSHVEYGETYEHTRLHFTRKKEPVELEIEQWQAKLAQLSELCAAKRTFEKEGQGYPRAAEIGPLEAELGAWASGHRSMGRLTIWDGEVVFYDMMRGGYRRDGTWLFRTMMADHYDNLARGMEAGTATTGTGVVHESPVLEEDAPDAA